MGMFTFLAGGLAARFAENRLKPPTVTSLDPGLTIIGIESSNLAASRWKASYFLDGRSNMTYSFTVHRGMREVSIGARKCKVFWPG